MQRGERKGCAVGHGRQVAHDLGQAFRTAQTATRASGQAAAALLETGKSATGDLQVQGDACGAFLDLDVEHFAAPFHDAFGQAEAQREVLEVGGCGQHYRVRNAVVLEGNWRLVSNGIEVGGAVWPNHSKSYLRLHA